MTVFLSYLPRNVCVKESKNQDKLKKLKLRMSWVARELNQFSTKEGQSQRDLKAIPGDV